MKIDQLRSYSRHDIRLHPNGFVQLEMPNRDRLHIWPTEALPTQKVSTPIHNHTFGFHSTVLTGRLVQITYDVFHDPEGDFVIHEVVHRPRDPSSPQGEQGTIMAPISEQERATAVLKSCQVFAKDTDYTFPPFEYHETFRGPALTATVLTKTLDGLARQIPSNCCAECGHLQAYHTPTEYQRCESPCECPGFVPVCRTEPFQPRVLCPYGKEFDNDFSRYALPKEKLWEVVAELVQTLKKEEAHEG